MRTLRPLYCRAVGGFDDNDRTTKGCLPKMPLNEFTNLTPTLAYERDDGNVGCRAFYDL